MTWDEAMNAASKAIYGADGRGMNGGNRRHLVERVARAIMHKQQEIERLRADCEHWRKDYDERGETILRLRKAVAEAVAWLRDPKLSTWRYVEGSEFSMDRDNLADSLSAALSTTKSE